MLGSHRAGLTLAGRFPGVSYSPAIPALLGQLTSGEKSNVEWALWPIEVYSSGCLIRLRLAPLGKWREYADFRHLTSTIHLVDGLEHEHILVSADTGELLQNSGRLPSRGVEPQTYEPWTHAWTIDYWWAHEQWAGDTITVTWPAHNLRLELPIDLDALTAAAEQCPRELPTDEHELGAARPLPWDPDHNPCRPPLDTWPMTPGT